LESGPVAAGRI